MEKIKDSPIYIAYAENHTFVREMLIQDLEKDTQIQFIIKVNNGAMLINALEKSETLPHICLLDIKMPIMDGFEATTILKERWPEIKILILSAFHSEDFKIRILRCGAHAFLSKESTSSEIKNAITLLHKNKVYSSVLFPGYFTHNMKRKYKEDFTFNPIELFLLKYSTEEISMEDIARSLHLSPKSIEAYRYKLYKKLGIKSRVGLAIYAIENGFIKNKF